MRDAERLDLWCDALREPEGGLVVMAPTETASLLGSPFHSKQCLEQFVPLFLLLLLLLIILLFYCVCFLILNHMGVFISFGRVWILLLQKMVADVIAPKQSIIFRRLIRLGSCPGCWQSANVTGIPKGAPSIQLLHPYQ